MNVKKISPIAEFLRANHAKAKNHNAYWTRTGEHIKTCEFYDDKDNYIGKMTRKGRVGYKPSFAYLQSYIEVVKPNFSPIYRQIKENVIHFAEILGKNGEKTIYVPETMAKTHTLIDDKSVKTVDKFERKISSKLELVKAADKNAYSGVSQNTYYAAEPIKYKEVQTAHEVTKLDKF